MTGIYTITNTINKEIICMELSGNITNFSDPEEAASIWNCHPSTIRRILNNKLKTYKKLCTFIRKDEYNTNINYFKRFKNGRRRKDTANN